MPPSLLLQALADTRQNLRKAVRSAVRRLQTLALCVSVYGLCTPVWAQQAGKGLPRVEDPSRGQGKGIFATAQNYLYDGAVMVGLLVSVLCFLAVAWHAVSVFSEVQRGKKTWADFGAVFVVGVLLIVLCIWLLTKSAEIL